MAGGMSAKKSNSSMEGFRHLQPPFILIENSLQPEEGGYLFDSPHELIMANRKSEIAGAFEAIEAALNRGDYVAGFMTYELGLALEPRLAARLKEPVPLMWFGAFSHCELVTNQDIVELLQSSAAAAENRTGNTKNKNLNISPRLDLKGYKSRFAKVKKKISSGDIYQLNLTFKADIENISDPMALYARMRRSQPVAYGSLIMTGEQTILSASPELFVESRDGWLESRPMKGTLRRGPTPEHQLKERAELVGDEKSRAENLMIVDLMRNDLGRIAELGSVSVDQLFKVETYRSLHQMISIIRARRREGLTFEDEMRALFPPGSITGAPKIRAMELIDELEDEPRGVYTGAIGFITPDRDSLFNVAIRTVEMDNSGKAVIGIGSGLVHDSKPKAEYDECLLKMQFLEKELPEFQILETIGYLPGIGLLLLDEHMARLENSARYFGYPFIKARAIRDLDILANNAKTPLRIRLLLHQSGNTTITSTEIAPPTEGEEWTIAFAKNHMESSNPFLYHKTTNRSFYDDARFAAQKAHQGQTINEVIFLNERNEVTEGSFTNIFLEGKKGVLITPPVSAGLLCGTLRQSLLEDGHAVEKTLTKKDLETARQIYVGNSVRGLIKANLVQS